jgi:hypothetical protein
MRFMAIDEANDPLVDADEGLGFMEGGTEPA